MDFRLKRPKSEKPRIILDARQCGKTRQRRGCRQEENSVGTAASVWVSGERRSLPVVDRQTGWGNHRLKYL
jgi:hypothetical protein